MADKPPASEMDYGQAALTCTAPDCPEVRLKPEDPTAAPFCADHTKLLKFVRFVLANTPIRVVAQPPAQEHGGLTLPTVVPPRDPTGGLAIARR